MFNVVWTVFECLNLKEKVTKSDFVRSSQQNVDPSLDNQNSGSEPESSYQLEVGSVTSSRIDKESRAKSDVFTEIEENLTQSIIRLFFMPFKVGFNVFCFFLCLPLNLAYEFCDAFIQQALSQLGLTKNDAS